MSVSENRKRITVTFDINTYNQLKTYANSKGQDLSGVVRDFTIEGLNGTLNSQNVDFLAPIIREQLKSILDPAVERIASLNAKTCIQAGTAAYLSADAILKFVPSSQREEVADSYEAARKKAVKYMKAKSNISE